MNRKIPFSFTYYAMKLLGKNLYSNPWTALSEIVANSIDAKADNVYILIDIRNKLNAEIEIFDDGKGMNYNDLCEKYTLIGRDKRLSDENDEGKTLGRKGIGKLAALYLSPKYYLCSRKDCICTSWGVDTTKYKDSDIPTMEEIDLCDESILSNDVWSKFDTGTLIKLTHVDLRKIGSKRLRSLYSILPDYYLNNVISTNINIAVIQKDGEEIAFQEVKKDICFETMLGIFDNTDNDYSTKLRDSVYISKEFEIEDLDKESSTIVLDPEKYPVSGKITMMDLQGELREVDYKLDGWIGIHASLDKAVLERTTANHKKLQMRPNSLRLYVRGKLAVDNLMNYIASSQALSNYIEGEISFDILDDDNFVDASTSNREGYSLNDPRVEVLISIVKKIIGSLFSVRIEAAKLNKKRIDNYNEEQKRIAREAQIEAENKERKARIGKERAEQELENAKENLESEKNRSKYFSSLISEDDIRFAKKIHMIKINHDGIEKTIDLVLKKHKKNKLTLENLLGYISTISYYNERVKAILDYFGNAKFKLEDEQLCDTNIFEFIKEYCEIVSNRIIKDSERDINIKVDIKNNAKFIRQCVPQDIGVLIENIISNSEKNNARTINIIMEEEETNFSINWIDDGNGVKKHIDKSAIFCFGKSYTSNGTGVGLYHIKNIVENMQGEVSVVTDDGKGFNLKMRFKK